MHEVQSIENERKFPEQFYWGTGTSSHQIEGDNFYNDWWRAEQEGDVKYKSGKACDSYRRYKEDFDLAKELGTNAHRFSLEWSRIEPNQGEFKESAIEHYRTVITEVKKRGLEPFVTLHHFTNPVWFSDMGGWENKNADKIFARYVEYVVKQLGANVTYWITINEPMIYALLGYIEEAWPPFETSFLSARKVATAMLKAHKRAYRIIKSLNPDALIGITNNNQYFEAFNNKFASRLVKTGASHVWNRWFFKRVSRKQDFIGINYYNHNRIYVRWSNPRSWFQQNENKEVTDFGWEIYPEGIYRVVKEVARYKKPIFIFENGIADADDDQRPKFIQDHLTWLQKAIEEGVDVKGYFYWSLIDNFEWAEGFTKRFGLVEVDFETFERKPRKSFYAYQEICKGNALKV